MTDETLELLREIQEKNCRDVLDLDSIIDTDTSMSHLNLVEKAVKIEHAELKMRSELAAQQLEADKFAYQKELDERNAHLQLKRSWLDNAPGLIQGATAFAHDCVLEMMAINDGLTREQFAPISSRTLRSCLDRFMRPRHR